MAQTVDALIEGGKATAAPPLGPALGPTGVNIGQVIAEINKKTADFKGMKVPVKVKVNDDKSFEISVGTPPASQLIKKEAGVDKGAGNPLAEKVADLKIQQVIKISKMKADSLLGKDNFSRVKEICGSCNSMGVLVEGMTGRDAVAAVNAGKWKGEIEAGKTELSAEELKAQQEQKQRMQEELKKKRQEFEQLAKSILKGMEGKDRAKIKAKMLEEKIPIQIIEELLPADTKAPAAPAKK